MPAMRTHPKGEERVQVAFKAMHEHVDSFGALPYAGEAFSSGRLARAGAALQHDSGGSPFVELGKVMGCSNAPWTGSLLLKQSQKQQISSLTLQQQLVLLST